MGMDDDARRMITCLSCYENSVRTGGIQNVVSLAESGALLNQASNSINAPHAQHDRGDHSCALYLLLFF
jgi:hypothetical protein